MQYLIIYSICVVSSAELCLGVLQCIVPIEGHMRFVNESMSSIFEPDVSKEIVQHVPGLLEEFDWLHGVFLLNCIRLCLCWDCSMSISSAV